jgi:CO/xanthine dehydrogenase Mo-binding subunit
VVRLPSGQAPAAVRVLADDPGQAEWHARPDIAGKLRGDAGFLTDVRAPGMLVARILRAGRPHARIVSIDTSRAEALAGVRAVVTHRDVAGQNAFGIMWADQPALCHDVVRHAGDPVAAVAAVDEATAEAALALIDVVYADLPPVTDPGAALELGAPALHPKGNLAAETALSRGDADAALARAVHVVSGTYATPRQMHAFLETEGGWCAPDGAGGLTVAVGGQHGARDREQLSRILAIPEDRIRVITSPIGGGFGGKDELTVQPALALLALKAGAAVRLHLSRAESILAGVKRNPMVIRMTTGVDATGRLCGHRVDVLADCGAYASLSPAVLETAMEHAAGPYTVADVTTRGRLAYTNNGLCGAFRGFGANQMTFAIEAQMDRLAAACGLDPAEIRRRNLRVPGTPGFLGQAVAGSERVAEMLEAAAASALWVAPTVEGEEIVATGMALNHQGNGLGSIPKDEVEGRLALSPDGAVEVACGLDEMGQGLVPALTAAVARHLGCGRADVRVVYGDTARAPDSGSTSASRGAFVAWHLAARSAPGFAAQVLALAGRALGVSPDTLRIVPGGVAPAGTNSVRPALRFADLAAMDVDALPEESTAFAFPKTDYTRGNARFVHCHGATLARVAVNRVTGMVRVTDLEMHTAAGPVIDLAAYLGQIEGGLLQGLGLTLTEDVLYADGVQRNGTLHGYTLPMLRDAPRYRVTALEGLDDGDPYGPRGVGELGIGAVTAAIANAVGAALGRWPEATPFQPETVLSLMEGA